MTEWTMDSGGLEFVPFCLVSFVYHCLLDHCSFYDISNIQGFSVEMNIIPSNGGCESKSCPNVGCSCTEAYAYVIVASEVQPGADFFFLFSPGSEFFPCLMFLFKVLISCLKTRVANVVVRDIHDPKAFFFILT